MYFCQVKFEEEMKTFLESLDGKIQLSDREKDIIGQYIIKKRIRKKQYVLQAGDICKSIAFVQKGALRAYSVSDDGSEHIMQFALEGWLISDLHSLMTETPALYNIDALEDTEIELLTKESREEIFKLVPQYEVFTRMELTGAYLSLQKRVNSLISRTVEQRYLDFIKLYPNIVQRVPQHMIASYLGTTPESLSRVRKNIIAHRK